MKCSLDVIPLATGQGSKAKRAKGKRAEGKGQRAKGKGQRAKPVKKHLSKWKRTKPVKHL